MTLVAESEDEPVTESYDSFAKVIGHVMLNAARVERLISVLVMRLAIQVTNPTPGASWSNLRREANRLISEPASGSRTDRELRALEMVRPTIDRANKLMDLRNLLAHGGWFVDESDEGPVLQIWVERKSGGRFERWSIKDIAQIAADIDAAADEIGRLANELRGLSR